MAAEISTENPYGMIPALQQGGVVAWGLFGVMVIMSAGSWFIMITKWFEQRRLLKEAREAEQKVWSAANPKDGVVRLSDRSPFRLLAEDGFRAFDHHAAHPTGDVDSHEWLSMTLNRTANLVSSRLNGGLSFLASVGATAPFIGLLGTVVGIYRALINIGMAGQASIDKVAGPVGEALIMTAIGLFVAVPAVIGYNYIASRNKKIMERLNIFAADIHSYLLSGARIARPTAGKAPAASAKPAPKAAK